jgi:hypothetical protein
MFRNKYLRMFLVDAAIIVCIGAVAALLAITGFHKIGAFILACAILYLVFSGGREWLRLFNKKGRDSPPGDGD